MQYRDLLLDPFQVEAISALDAGESVLVCAPTGTGKTVVADWVVERALARGRQVIYTAPIKALSNQKYRDYCRLFGADNVGLVTGDLVIRRDAPCRVMTTEILRNMLLCGEPLPDLDAVVVDEIHFLDDEERGTTWEEVLIYLDKAVQVVGLSATLSNLQDFGDWLRFVRGGRVRVVEEHQRAVPLEFRVASREGGLLSPPEMMRFHRDWLRRNAHAMKRAHKLGGRHARVGATTRHYHLFKVLWPDDAPYLYFVFSRRDAEGMARGLVRRIDESLLDLDEALRLEAELARFRAEPGGATALDAETAAMYRMGIAFHHAGLHVMLKALVETLYEQKLVKVLYCTSTFALGINMPARTAVFDGLMRYDGRQLIPLPTREFMQMAGRAGRRGMDDWGLVVVRADVEFYEDMAPRLEGYLAGRYEPVRSRFSLSFNSVVNLLERHPPARIRELVEKSFLAFHRARTAGRESENSDRLAESLQRQGWSEGMAVPPSLKKEIRRLRRLRSQSNNGGDRTWLEFQEKVTFLQRWGYIDEEGGFNAGAQVLTKVQIAEIFTTELFLGGVFDDLDMPTLFGVFCGMCNELPRGVTTPASRAFRGLARQVSRIRFSPVVTGAEELTRSQVTWDPEMVGLGHLWASGRPLAELMLNLDSATDVSGDLVGAFRRAKDLAGQLREVWETADPDRAKHVRELIRKVSRDEVEVVD